MEIMIADQGPQDGQRINIEHRPELARRSGKQEEMWNAVSCGDVNTRRRTVVVRKHRCAVGHVGLACGAIGDLQAALFKAFADLLENGFVVAQRTAGQFRDDFPGNVVRSRTQTAGHENDIASGGGFLDRHANGIAVWYSRLLLHSQSKRKKLLGEKREVGVDHAAEKEFRARVQDFNARDRAHDGSRR